MAKFAWISIAFVFFHGSINAQEFFVFPHEFEPIQKVEEQSSLESQIQLPFSKSSEPQLSDLPTRSLEKDESALIKKLAAKLRLRSGAVAVFDETLGTVLYGKNTSTAMPIASITKLMTAMVVLDAGQPLEEKLAVENADVDKVRRSSSRLPVGAALTRQEMLRLALMASENRAASALGRNYPGGMPGFVAAMNRKAALLGLSNTHFMDSTGLSSNNVSTAQDLISMVKASYNYPLIREYTTTPSYRVDFDGRKERGFKNSNTLVRSKSWEIGLSKTGYIKEAGRCLVMQAKIANKPVIIVLLDSWGKRTRVGDANRIKKWMERNFADRSRLAKVPYAS